MTPVRMCRVLSALVAVSIAATGCDPGASSPVDHEGQISPVVSAFTTSARYSRGIEDEFVALEREIPGFGGFILDEDGNIQAYLKDLSRSQEAASAVQAAFLGSARNADRFRRNDGSFPTVYFVQGDYAMSELIHWKLTLWDAQEASHGIRLMDADESLNRVRIGVASGEAIPAVQRLATREGVPLEALDFRVMTGEFRTTGNLRTVKKRPTVAGYQTMRLFVAGSECSMGFNVRDSSGNRYFLTAGHCTANFTGGTGQQFTQPTNTLADSLGSVSVNPAWSTTGCGSGATYCADADAALVTPLGSVGMQYAVAQTSTVGTGSGEGSPTSVGTTFSIAGTQSGLATSTVVHKTGRATGTTSGPITGTCVSYVAGSQGLEAFCSHQAQLKSDEGDSGGPVYRELSGQRYAIGVVHSAYDPLTDTLDLGDDDLTFFSDWGQIQSHLGMTLTATAPSPPLSVTLDGPTHITPWDNCTWEVFTSHGPSPYLFAFDGVLQQKGTSSTVGGTIAQSGWLTVDVVDADNQHDADQLFITVDDEAPGCTPFDG